MEIGTVIAVAGVWLFVGLLGKSDTVPAHGLLLGIVVAFTVTVFLAWLLAGLA